jgi:hypothetical protein
MRVHKRGYLVDIENIKKEFILLIEKYKHENLCYAFLKNNGYNYLLCAIQRTGLSYREFLKFIDYEVVSTPNGYYKNIDNINKEIYNLIEKYGYFPNDKSILKLEHKCHLDSSLRKHHNISLIKYLKSLGVYVKNNKSHLEMYVKSLLDKFILDKNFIDNGRKELFEKGLLLKNPETNRLLEIDRYYFDAKVAIEIQGKQHYVDCKLWNSGRLNNVKKIDQIKKELLLKQNIYLIEIHYQRIGKATIYEQLKGCASLKLCEKEKIFE